MQAYACTELAALSLACNWSFTQKVVEAQTPTPLSFQVILEGKESNRRE